MTKEKAIALIREHGSNRDNADVAIKPTKWIIKLGRAIERGLKVLK